MSVDIKSNQKTFAGPFSKVVFEFKHDEGPGRDSLNVTLFGEDGVRRQAILVTTRVSPLDGAVLMTATDLDGVTF